jgi:hypothetical protein
MNEIRRGNEEPQHEGRPGRQYRYEPDAALCSILQRWSECLIANHGWHVSNLPGDCSHSYVADWLYSEIFTVDSPCADRSAKTGLFRFGLTIAPKLGAHAHNNSRHLVTGDESWFYYKYVRDRIETARDENMPEAENGTIASTKTMLTVIRNPHSFHIVTMLSPGESFNASWFMAQNLVPLFQSFFPSGSSSRQKIDDSHWQCAGS